MNGAHPAASLGNAQLHGAVARTLAIDAETVRVVTALREHSVDPILLKGPSFASWLYRDGRPRPYIDTDLLIHPGVSENARKALKELGYETLPSPPGPSPAATTWLKNGTVGSIDLHTGIWLFDETTDAWERLQKHTQPFLLAGITVTVLDDVAKTVHVVTHALQHEFKEAGPNADLELAVRLVPEDTWLAAATLAVEVGAYDAFAYTLSTWPGARALAQRIGVEGSVSPPARIRLLAAGVSGTGAGTFHELGALSHWADRLALLTAKVFPSHDFVESIGLLTGKPSSRPEVNYARYWGRLLRKAPNAMRVWYLDRRRSRG